MPLTDREKAVAKAAAPYVCYEPGNIKYGWKLEDGTTCL